jgi:hypothetical protein
MIQHELAELAMIFTLLIPFDAIFLSGGLSLIASSSLCSALGTSTHVWRREYPSSPAPQRLVRRTARLSECILRHCI